MKNQLDKAIRRVMAARHAEHRRAAVLVILALLTILSVSWRLHQVGTAMTDDEYSCGYEEHVHSDVDVMLVGDLEFSEVVLALSDTQTTLRREVNPTVLSRAEFEDKLLQSDSFVAQVWRGSKLWVMGEP